MALDTAVLTYTGTKLEPYYPLPRPAEQAVAFVASLGLLAKGTVIAEVTASGLWAAYTNTGPPTDGTQIPRAILAYDINVDSNGRITFTTTSGQVGDEFGHTYLSAPAYFTGAFRLEDLTGLDANAISLLNGRVISIGINDATKGVFVF
jgi:hypothetical protein